MPVRSRRAETVERLALALAKPGSDAMLIDEGNLSAGRMPIPEAASSGRPFAVELRDAIRVGRRVLIRNSSLERLLGERET